MSESEGSTGFDPFMTAILANRMDGVIREMTNTLLRAGRSAVLNTARDFSCAICTADNQLLAAAEGLPIHIFGSHMQAQAMCDFNPDLREGDCYLHNDPYTGNTHAADHTFLVPVFVEGEHLFTTVVKAHQADIGNSLPTTYMAAAKDQYEEGALIFPAVAVQRDYEMVEDVVRMCRSRIRVPGQWYGDFLAGIGAARVGERRLKEVADKYGKAALKAFVTHWLDYSEQRMAAALKKLPKATLTNTGAHDPFEGVVPDGIPLKVTVHIDPDEGMVDLDLTDNIDCLDCGLNESEACVGASTFAGIFNSIDPTVPRNSGAFRRVRLHLRDGSVAGRPSFPHSTSVATTNVADRLINIVQAAFAEMDDGFGLAEGGVGLGAAFAVVSGRDPRHEGESYVNQIHCGSAGGPAGPVADGWVTYGIPVIGGLMYRDSIEVDELKHPMQFAFVRVVPGTGGAGRHRGAPGMEVSYGPKTAPMDVLWPCDGTVHAPKGVRGGADGMPCRHLRIGANGDETELGGLAVLRLAPGERVHGRNSGGGGYGQPLQRDPQRVLRDVLERYETAERAHDVYGVVLTGAAADESLAVDRAATEKRRSELLSAMSAG